MKYKIYKILFVFAIFFGNIATPAAMTLDEYWDSTNVWNIWTKEVHTYLDNSIRNVRCKTSTDNPCCAYLDEKFIGTEQKVYVIAYYPGDTQKKEDTVSLTPTTCEYSSNACFSCNLQLDANNKITGDCLKSSYTDIPDLTCPTDHQSYAKCEELTDENKEYQVNNTQILIHIMECRCSNDNEEPDDNNMCPTYTAGDGNQCAPGYYGTTDCKKCPTGSYCPDGINKKTCPSPWNLSNAGADEQTDCYVTLTSGQYIDIKEKKIISGCQNNSICPGGNIYYEDDGLSSCTYTDNEKDTAANILNWLRDACPLATDTNAITDITIRKSWKSDNTTCYADITIDTTCGTIVKEAVPMTNGKYLTWHNGKEIRSHYYNSLVAGLYATTLYSADYCTSVNPDTPQKRQLYKQAHKCPGGKYCTGFPNGAPNCPNDGTNPTEFPPTGDVAAGYYSTGGAYQEKPTKPGQGCLPGHDCGQCPTGSTSPAGAASCSTCPKGEYSDTDGASTCKSCTKGYFCINGLRNKCPAGSTSEAGKSAITDCYIKGGTGGTGFCVTNKCFNIQTNVFYKQPSN